MLPGPANRDEHRHPDRLDLLLRRVTLLDEVAVPAQDRVRADVDAEMIRVDGGILSSHTSTSGAFQSGSPMEDRVRYQIRW